MSKDYSTLSPTHVRRADRAVDDETWLKQFLHTAALGIMATVHEGQPFLNSNLFVYDEAQHCLYIHTARVGRTRANLEKHAQVCFTITQMGRILPAPEALEFSVEYAGVVVFGVGHIVEDEAESTQALQAMLDKYAPHLSAGEDYRPPVPEELARTTVMRIDITEWSAKRKVVDEHEGAFWYAEEAMLPSLHARLQQLG
jgi:nitroimidazol reductase NimA-like FMN-containing flavoprotein (pyridoxamine 5'-phosphate oxidase superfamily)